MLNGIGSGDSVNLVAGGSLTSGQGLLVGSLFGIVAADAVSGDVYALHVKGIFELPLAAVSPTVGAKAYWDNTNAVVTTVSTSNTLIGTFVQAQTSGDPTALVRLDGAAR